MESKNGIISRMAWLNATYSASVVESVISVLTWHIIPSVSVQYGHRFPSCNLQDRRNYSSQIFS